MMDIGNLTTSQRIEYERRFAAGVAIAPEYARKECGWLEPGRFVAPTIAAFWQGILDGEDIVSAAHKAGRDFYGQLSGWIAQEATPENLRAYASEIARWSYLFDVAGGLSTVAKYVSRGDVDRVRQTLAELSEQQSAGQSSSVAAEHGLDQFAETLDHLGGRSLQTFIGPLDMATGGMERQTLTILAARPGMGKSALAWQIARNVAQHRQRALFVSLEMSQTALWARAACGVTGLRWRNVRSGQASRDDIARLKAAAENLKALYAGRLYVNDKPQTVASVWNEIAILRPDVVVIDHLRWLRDSGDKEVVRLGTMTSQLKEAGKEFNCSMLVLHQLNRGVMGRDDKRPTLSDLRESGQVEENADAVWFIHRDDYFDHDSAPVVSQSEVLLAKFRDDVANQSVLLDFHMNAQWFTRRGERPEV